MYRFLIAGLAAFGLVAFAVAPTAAGEKKDGVCAAGQGKPFDYAAWKDAQNLYVSSCEQGNAGFFSAKQCPVTGKVVSRVAGVKQVSSASCAVSSASCSVTDKEMGNAGFFRAVASSCSAPVSASACAGETACCAKK